MRRKKHVSSSSLILYSFALFAISLSFLALSPIFYNYEEENHITQQKDYKTNQFQNLFFQQNLHSKAFNNSLYEIITPYTSNIQQQYNSNIYENAFERTQKKINRESFAYEYLRILGVNPYSNQRYVPNTLVIGTSTSVGNLIYNKLKYEKNQSVCELNSIYTIQFSRETLDIIFNNIKLEGIIICFDPIIYKTNRNAGAYIEQQAKNLLKPLIDYIKDKNLKFMFVTYKYFNFDFDYLINGKSIVFDSLIVDSKIESDTSNELLSAYSQCSKTNKARYFDINISSITAEEASTLIIQQYLNFIPGSIFVEGEEQMNITTALNLILQNKCAATKVQFKHKFKDHSQAFSTFQKIKLGSSQKISQILENSFKFNENEVTMTIEKTNEVIFIYSENFTDNNNFGTVLYHFGKLSEHYPLVSFEVFYYYQSESIPLFDVPDRIKNITHFIHYSANSSRLIQRNRNKLSLKDISSYVRCYGDLLEYIHQKDSFVFFVDQPLLVSPELFEIIQKRALNKYIIYTSQTSHINEASFINSKEQISKLCFQPWIESHNTKSQSINYTGSYYIQNSTRLYEISEILTNRIPEPMIYGVSLEMLEAINGIESLFFTLCYKTHFLSHFMKLLPGIILNMIPTKAFYVKYNMKSYLLCINIQEDVIIQYSDFGYLL